MCRGPGPQERDEIARIEVNRLEAAERPSDPTTPLAGTELPTEMAKQAKQFRNGLQRGCERVKWAH